MGKIEQLLNYLMEISEQWARMSGNLVISPRDSACVRNELIMISQEIQKNYPTICVELFRLKDIFCGQARERTLDAILVRWANRYETKVIEKKKAEYIKLISPQD